MPELAIAMLACARIGAIHSVIFGGFSSEAIADRNNDAKAKLVITADGGWRRGQQVAAESKRRRGAGQIARRSRSASCCAASATKCTCKQGRDHLVARPDERGRRPIARPRRWIAKRRCSSSTPAARPASRRESSTPRPATTCSPRKPSNGSSTIRDEDVFWCTADCGWVTGHSYVVYGPLSAGAHGADVRRARQLARRRPLLARSSKNIASAIFYTAPTAIRSFIKWGDHWVDACDLSSLRLLGTVGEGINPEAWMWYHRKIGGERCPIVDTWWQTETGGIMMSPLPGAIPTKPGSCTKPLPGIVPAIVDDRRQAGRRRATAAGW